MLSVCYSTAISFLGVAIRNIKQLASAEKLARFQAFLHIYMYTYIYICNFKQDLNDIWTSYLVIRSNLEWKGLLEVIWSQFHPGQG